MPSILLWDAEALISYKDLESICSVVIKYVFKTFLYFLSLKSHVLMNNQFYQKVDFHFLNIFHTVKRRVALFSCSCWAVSYLDINSRLIFRINLWSKSPKSYINSHISSCIVTALIESLFRFDAIKSSRANVITCDAIVMRAYPIQKERPYRYLFMTQWHLLNITS